MADMIPDPRAVRVRLSPSSAMPGDPAMVVSPEPEALHMTNPTVGTGPFGGAAMTDGDPDEEGAVLAQRQVLVDGERSGARLRPLGRDRYRLEEGSEAASLVLGPEEQAGASSVREVLVDGFRLLVEIESERIAALRERASRGRASGAAAGPLQVKAIIPGKVVAVSVGAGDEVTAGQQLLVVEAMKMQNELRAPRDGTVERVGVAVGVNIEIGDLLVVIS